MPQAEIAKIRAARDAQLAGLGIALERVGDEIAVYTKSDDYQLRLAKRQQELVTERSAVREIATNSVLALPEVVEAAVHLIRLGDQMTKRANEMKTATKILQKSAQLIGVAQNFVDTIVTKKKK